MWILLCLCVLKFYVVNIAARVKLLLPLGLCGDYNDVEVDDFKTSCGLIEGTASIFASMWKMDLNCVDVKTTEDPCTMSINSGSSRSPPSKLTIDRFFSHGHSCFPSVCFCRGLRQALVRLAVRPQRRFCQVSFWSKPKRLWKRKQSPSSYLDRYLLKPLASPILWPHQRFKSHNFVRLHGITPPHRPDSAVDQWIVNKLVLKDI